MKKKTDRTTLAVRIFCLFLAALMVLGALTYTVMMLIG